MDVVVQVKGDRRLRAGLQGRLGGSENAILIVRGDDYIEYNG